MEALVGLRPEPVFGQAVQVLQTLEGGLPDEEILLDVADHPPRVLTEKYTVVTVSPIRVLISAQSFWICQPGSVSNRTVFRLWARKDCLGQT